MRIIVLLGLLISVTNVIGQQVAFSNEILLFRNSNPSPDTCICYRDKAAHEYFFIDASNYIHYVRDALGAENVEYKFDTSTVGGVTTIAPVEYLRPHEVLSIFKFSRQKNKLFLNTKIGKDTSTNELFYDFKTGEYACYRTPLTGTEPDTNQKIILLSEDSVIRFNGHIFKCWYFQELTSYHVINVCIDKSSLIPLAYEIQRIQRPGEFIDGGLEHEKYSVWGMLELRDDSIKQLKIWKDPF